MGQANIYPFDFKTAPCPGRPKTNESYVFGLTRVGNTLWFGTAPNMGCLVYGTIAEQGVPGGLIELETPTSACEYAAGVYGNQNGLPDHLADWRPPSIYTYELDTGTLTRKEIDEPRLLETLGLRSAGSFGNIVFLAGPYLTGMGGPDVDGAVYLYAFRADTQQYLGSQVLEQYLNIRKWLVVDGVSYAGVMVKKALYADPKNAPGGAILRWTGNALDPFSFEIVGWVDGDPAELAAHEGRIFASTWPDFSLLFEDKYDYAGLWMSPLLSPSGLTSSQAKGWTKVWTARDYEQDEVTARMYNGGALASYQGYLYWGTTHAPMSAGLAHAQTFGFADPDDLDNINLLAMATAIIATHRPISIFRGRGFGAATHTFEMLYGLDLMPAYIAPPGKDPSQRTWTLVPNDMGPARYGPAGINNLYNTYTWTMDVYNGELFIGTMDWHHMLMGIILPAIFQNSINPFPEIELPGATFGADLFTIPNRDSPAVELSRNGMHNGYSYGVRTMLASEDGLYLGMANASNLATDPTDPLPEGGWELLRLSRSDCPISAGMGVINGNEVLDWLDVFGFIGCYTGPCHPGLCTLPLYDNPFCAAGDADFDGDVDFWDVIWITVLGNVWKR